MTKCSLIIALVTKKKGYLLSLLNLTKFYIALEYALVETA